jgi:hypothetical protein
MNYTDAERKWTTTKPIRGRSVEVRPIGVRRRDWEQIQREAIDEGIYAYHAVLYGTRVITWYPNGDIVLRTGGWQTPSTAEFIHQWSPFGSAKRNNKVWVSVRVDGDHPSNAYKALPVGDELRLNSRGNGFYTPAMKVVIKKQVVDRNKAKAAREPVQPFLAWAKVFLKLSDGWVMHETRKQVLGWEPYSHNGGMHMPLNDRNEDALYKLLTAEQSEIMPEDTYLRVLCCMAPFMQEESRKAGSHSFDDTFAGKPHTFVQTFEDYRVSFDAIKRKVYYWVNKHEDVHNIIEVEPERQPIYGTI